jgi:transcriptional regulator with XRE-family HTH domain
MTPSLIRAARGLLGWQQHELAKAACLSLSAVNNFERELGHTRKVTVMAMVAALEEAGIEFLPGGAIRRSDDVNNVQRLAGSDFIHKLNDDIFAAVRKPGSKIYTCSTDEARWFDPGVKDASEKYYAWRRKMGVEEFYLVAEGNTVFESPRQHYRFLSANLIGKITYAIYADRIALILWRKKQVFILRGNQLIEPFREQFKFLWRQGRRA